MPDADFTAYPHIPTRGDADNGMTSHPSIVPTPFHLDASGHHEPISRRMHIGESYKATFRIPAKLHRRLGIHAINAGVTRSELVTRAVESLLARIESPGV